MMKNNKYPPFHKKMVGIYLIIILYLFVISCKIKYYTYVSFDENIFNKSNRKSDSIWVQIESLLAEKERFA